MANNSNVSKAEYIIKPKSFSYLPADNANIDANYGPWISTDAYEAWLQRTDIAGAGATPIEGTLIAVQPTEHTDVTLYVYTSNVGNGTWKPVGSGGTGADDIGYVPDNVEVQLLNKQVVSTSANQGLNPTQQDNARKNIGAVATDDLNNNYYKKSETYTQSQIDDSIRQIQAAAGGDLSGYYTSEQVNAKLNEKANANDVVFATDVTQDILGTKTFKGKTKLEGEFASVNVLKLPELEAGNFLQLNNNNEVVGVSGMLVSQAEKNTWDTKQNRLTAGDGIDINGGEISVDYQNETAAQNGTDLSLVTTGEKYVWNSKQDTISVGTGLEKVGNTLSVDGAVVVKCSGTQSIGGEKIFTDDVTIGSVDTNKDLIVYGTVASGTISTNAFRFGGEGTSGALVRDSQGYVSHKPFIPTVLSMNDLPATATNGEIYNVAETGDTYKRVVQTVETVDTDLHVSYIDKSDNTRKTLDIDIADTQPAITISTFFSELGTTGYSAFSNYPFIASTKTNLSYDIYVVPVQTDKGICIALVYYMTDPCVAYVVSRWYSGNKANTWYVNDVIHEQGPLIKLFSDLSEAPNKRYVFPVDGDDLSTQVQYFVPNAANNNTQKSWEKIVKSTDLTINGNGTILTYGIVTESNEYSDIEDLISYSKIPLLYDSDNNVYYHYCGHYGADGSGKYVFESVVYDNGTFIKTIKVCSETAGPDWKTYTSDSTFTEVTNE